MPSSTSLTARAGDGHGALLPRPRPRRRRQRVEQVHQAAEVHPRCRSAARRAHGAAHALRHELARRDSKGHGRLLLWQERLREGRTVELLRLIGEAGSRWHQISRAAGSMAPPSPNTPGLSPLSRCPSLKPCRDGCSSRPPLPPPQFTPVPRLSRLIARPCPHLLLVAHALAFPSPRRPGSARPPAPAHDATLLPSPRAVRLNPHGDNVPPPQSCEAVIHLHLRGLHCNTLCPSPSGRGDDRRARRAGGDLEPQGHGYRNHFLDLARRGAVAEAFFHSEIHRRLAVTIALIELSRMGYFTRLPGFGRRLIPDSYLSFSALPAGLFHSSLGLHAGELCLGFCLGI
jgi:hypothetical protein